MQPTTKLTLTLEWFLNPDHLPFIAGVTTGAYEQAGLDITIIEPDDHYDGFAELQKQSIDLHVNEPIHLFEHYAPNLRALGCFFETDGGILMQQSSMWISSRTINRFAFAPRRLKKKPIALALRY